MLTGEGLHKSWGRTRALLDVGVKVEPGTITALVGPSGSGKTTLIRALALLDPPDRGVIGIDGEVYRFPRNNRAEFKPPWPKVTVVFQQLFLWPHLRLRDNILLPLRKQAQSEVRARLARFVEAFRMHEFIDRYPNETSLGQRQRAALVRAIMLNPSYLLLDEITSALDPENTAVILDQLEELRREGIGILIVSHLIGFVRRAADHIIFLDEGRVVEAGDRTVLVNPRNERVKRFVSILESAH